MIKVTYVVEFLGGVALGVFLVLYLWPFPMNHKLGSSLILAGLGLTILGRGLRKGRLAKPLAMQNGKTP